MDFNTLMREHGYATLMMNTCNTNGTTWLCSDGNRCNSGVDYRVLVQGHCRASGVHLGTLFDEYDVLEVQVDGVTLY